MKYVNRPKTVRGEKTLQNIIEAAETVFYHKGYNGSTIKDISKKAGVSVGTIYIYFPDKKSIYDYLLNHYSKFIRRKIAERIAGAKTRREAEKLGLLVFLEIVKERKFIYNIIWESLYIDKQKFVDYYQNFAKRYIEQINEAVGKGTMNEAVDEEIMAWSLMGISNFIGLKYVMFEDHDDLEEIAEKVMQMLEQNIFINDKENKKSDKANK